MGEIRRIVRAFEDKGMEARGGIYHVWENPKTISGGAHPSPRVIAASLGGGSCGPRAYAMARVHQPNQTKPNQTKPPHFLCTQLQSWLISMWQHPSNFCEHE